MNEYCTLGLSGSDESNTQEAFEFQTQLILDLDLKNEFKGQKIDLFVITEDNFDILYRTKDVTAYKTFFDRNYK